MTKHWRPEEWQNPHKCHTKGCCTDKVFVLEHNDYDADIYEAGADAMLESLKQTGEKFSAGWFEQAFDYDTDGWLVFIPDEGEE